MIARMPTPLCAKPGPGRRLLGRAGAWAAALACVLAPALGRGDTVRLRDGSTLRGHVVRMVADTLLFRLSFGGEVRVPRERIVWIDLTDSARVVESPVAATPTLGAVSSPDDSGEVAVTFKDRKLSSKIVITKKKDWDGHVRANWIVQTLLVDGEEVHTVVDSVMDKTIYKGPDRILKNDVELVDLLALVPAGPHQCAVLVRNYGADTYRERFDGNPLHVEFTVDVQVYGGRETRLHLGLDRGRFRTKSPRFYRVEQ
jgi:hypothetical protein